MAQQGARRGDVEAVEQCGEVGGSAVLAKRRGAAYVGEQDRDVDLGSTHRERITTTAAQIGVLA
jgi:hypothetical protein